MSYCLVCVCGWEESLRFFLRAFWASLSLSSLVVTRFFSAFFLSHCWWRYRNNMFVFSVVIICSDGWSFVGRYTDGFFDEVRQPSDWNLVKFWTSNTGSPFRYSDVDIVWKDVIAVESQMASNKMIEFLLQKCFRLSDNLWPIYSRNYEKWLNRQQIGW